MVCLNSSSPPILNLKTIPANQLIKNLTLIYVHHMSCKLLAVDYLKGIYLSKALTCMKIFLYKHELLFCQGDRYLSPQCCMNNLYMSHRSLYAPSYSFWAIRSMLIGLFRVTSWFDTVYNVVTRWMNFGKAQLHKHELQLSDYNIKKCIGPKCTNFW